MMNYKDTLEYLYNVAPMFQQVGGKAYKEGLDNSIKLDAHFGQPHKKFRSIHVAGTNGKGSCSHTLAAILQAAGYRVGLYTSPHLVDFRERIRVDGVRVPQEYVVKFVEEERGFFEPLHPSFFELTTAMAMRYFADERVDVAVIEVGMGGRLDCTNIIKPCMGVITNIGMDHTQYLGDTLEKIAAEKAGIIKAGVPVVVGEVLPQTRPVFEAKAAEMKAPLLFAEELLLLEDAARGADGVWNYHTKDYGLLLGELQGLYQVKNTRTILAALSLMENAGLEVNADAVKKGFARVCEMTGLMGRWQVTGTEPKVVCDTGHNADGVRLVCEQLATERFRKLHVVWGMCADKDVPGILRLLPADAVYYFTQASVKRALPAQELMTQGVSVGLQGSCYADVPAAVQAALDVAATDDLVFIGGSSFVVADWLATREKK